MALVHVCGHKQGGWGWGRHSASSPPPDGLAGVGGPGDSRGGVKLGQGPGLKREPGAAEGLGVGRFKAAVELQRGGQDLSWGTSFGRGREGNREGDNLGSSMQTQKREGRRGQGVDWGWGNGVTGRKSR